MSIFETWQPNWFGPWKLKDDATNVPLLSQIIDENWKPPDLVAIISYLENAPGGGCTTLYPNSICVLCGEELGSPDIQRSDNSWVWTDNLAHYVAKHHVRLPDRMVAHIRAKIYHHPNANPTLPTAPPPLSN
jgi:hypothetical protein